MLCHRLKLLYQVIDTIHSYYVRIMFSYFNIGWEHQKRGEYNDAVRNYELAIQKGHQGAKFHLKCMYSGQGIPGKNMIFSWNDVLMSDASIEEMLSYYSEFDTDPWIQNNIGLLYKIYKGDIETAEVWYLKSVHQGYPVAMVNLGSIFQEQELFNKMNELYLLGAHYGNAIAQNRIATSYYRGRGVTQDYERALFWYTKASENEYSSAQCNLGRMYERGKGIPKNPEIALKWYLRALEHSVSPACNYLGQFYERQHDYERAKGYYELGIQKGNKIAGFNLGNLYHNMIIWVDPEAPDKITKNYEETYKWYNLAKDCTDPNVCYTFGLFYENKETSYHDYTKMLTYFTLAANQGHDLSIERCDYYLSVQRKIIVALKKYIKEPRNEGISYLFFGNFLAYLNRTIGSLSWNDPMIRPWVTDALTSHFKTLKLDVEHGVIDMWYSNFL